jgi:hypothetical protein
MMNAICGINLDYVPAQCRQLKPKRKVHKKNKTIIVFAFQTPEGVKYG